MFDYISKEFLTIKAMDNEKKLLINNLCNHFGLKRENFRLQQGAIMLQGKTENGVWINLTNTIGDFKEKIRNKNYKSFRLRSYLVKK